MCCGSKGILEALPVRAVARRASFFKTRSQDTFSKHAFHEMEVIRMKRLRSIFIVTIGTLFMLNTALAQEASKQESNAAVTIVTAGDILITRGADGKTAVSINFVEGKPKSADIRIAISGPYTLDVNGGVKEVKGAKGEELHVLSHEELRFEAPEIAVWEQSHKYTKYTACMKIPKFAGCGNPVCDQAEHPEDQCRYNSDSGCACVSPSGGPCSRTANAPQ
jgi:hypothetical protein